jgi:hypothetical protein
MPKSHDVVESRTVPEQNVRVVPKPVVPVVSVVSNVVEPCATPCTTTTVSSKVVE